MIKIPVIKIFVIKIAVIKIFHSRNFLCAVRYVLQCDT